MDHSTVNEQEVHAAASVAQQSIQLDDPVFFGANPDDEVASCGGAGTLEILEVTRLFEKAGLPCCMVGISALIYFGAWRVRNDWEICVPTDMVNEAAALLNSEDIYVTYQPGPVQPWSLLHTFPRFKVKGKSLYIIITPSEDSHLDCSASNIERSRMGLPYPTLETFTQSLLDRNDIVTLTDLVDGMDLTYEWGLQHLKLDSENDVVWAEQKNEKIRSSVPATQDSCLLELSTTPMSLKDTWHNVVQGKDSRIGMECPKEVFATRFRVRGDGDPRLRDRDEA
ncbi:hypothetical protein BU16DRAFT_516621 [Lophium mytilinum]|uniref:Uncharacterized protein n=1 Tax=Lophium mytilinum TaxID=390894 RepID=A0A6A6QF76_9PEZI|nr:hypothetical protein BU16DRAFT_516621 [Lophium mytilinum]